MITTPPLPVLQDAAPALARVPVSATAPFFWCGTCLRPVCLEPRAVQGCRHATSARAHLLHDLVQPCAAAPVVPRRAPSGGRGHGGDPRAHLRRWLELVHSAVMLLDAPLGASRGIVNALLLVISFALGVLACAVFF